MTATKLTRPRDQIHILLLEGIHAKARTFFADSGYTNVRHEAGALSRDDLIAAISNAHLIGIRSRTNLDAEVLEHAKRLIAVGCFCIGTNQVDLQAAAAQGVPVFNAPHSNTRSVAELVIGLSVMLFRDVYRKSVSAHAGGWQKTAVGSRELRGKTMGIVGYGHIGSQVSILAEAMGMKVIFHDIRPLLALGNAAPERTLADVLARSDVVTLHVPDTKETRGLMGATQIAQMKKGSYLINASRGTVVDTDALAEALKDGRVGGAAVDVFPIEPRKAGDEFQNALRGIDNVILTPHVGGSTQEAQENIAVDAASKLVSFSDSGNTTGAVNFPQLNLQAHEDGHRVLHIHKNLPGVLAQINDVFSGRGANIVGQHLQTHGSVGYAVTDVTGVDAQVLLPELRAIDSTLRTRVLY